MIRVASGNEFPECQINPVFKQDVDSESIHTKRFDSFDLFNMEKEEFEVLWLARIPALGFKTFSLIRLNQAGCVPVKIQYQNVNNIRISSDNFQENSLFPTKIQRRHEMIDSKSSFHLENKIMRFQFSTKTGLLLQTFSKQDSHLDRTAVSFWTRNASAHAGVKVMANGVSHEVYKYTSYTPYRRLHGVIESQIQVIYPHVVHRVRVSHVHEDSFRGLKIDNIVTLRDAEMENKELSMVVDTGKNVPHRVVLQKCQGKGKK